MVLLNTVFIYMMTALVFPDFFGEGAVDLKENFYAPARMVFHAGLLHHRYQRMQRYCSRWQTAKHDESHLPRDLRRNVIHRCVDALGALPQRTYCFWQRALRRLYRRAFRTNSIGLTTLSHQPHQDFDHFRAPSADLFSVHCGQFVDQLLAFGGKLNLAPAPVSFNYFAGDEFSFRQAVDNVDSGMMFYLKALAQMADGQASH